MILLISCLFTIITNNILENLLTHVLRNRKQILFLSCLKSLKMAPTPPKVCSQCMCTGFSASMFHITLADQNWLQICCVMSQVTVMVVPLFKFISKCENLYIVLHSEAQRFNRRKMKKKTHWTEGGFNGIKYVLVFLNNVPAFYIQCFLVSV